MVFYPCSDWIWKETFSVGEIFKISNVFNFAENEQWGEVSVFSVHWFSPNSLVYNTLSPSLLCKASVGSKYKEPLFLSILKCIILTSGGLSSRCLLLVTQDPFRYNGPESWTACTFSFSFFIFTPTFAKSNYNLNL